MNLEKHQIAAFLSLVVPGAGQLYNGALLRALFWFVITPGFWVGTGGMLGWVCHLISAYTAYQYAMAHGYERRGLGRLGRSWLEARAEAGKGRARTRAGPVPA